MSIQRRATTGPTFWSLRRVCVLGWTTNRIRHAKVHEQSQQKQRMFT